MSTIVEILIEGRMVCGHPLARRGVTKTDPNTRQTVPLIDQVSGLQKTEAYFAVAIPKNGQLDWKQTNWGMQIVSTAQAAWPNGEWQSAQFAWKIVDGDSQVPNKTGKKPCEREGWQGHWVVHMTTMFNVQCYHVGNYDPLQQIQNENEIKCGDYCRVAVNVKGNNPSQTPGVYLNPRLFELSRAGEQIISESGPNAATVFGGAPAVQQPVQSTSPAVQQPVQSTSPAVQQPVQSTSPAVQQPVQPAYDFLTVEGKQYTVDQLRSFGWTDDQINAAR